MDNDFSIDLAEIAATVHTAEVVAIRFVSTAQRLLLDFRSSELDGPMVRVVEPVTSVEERYRSLRRLRPRFPAPEKIVAIWWPRFVTSLESTGIWDEILERVRDGGNDEAVERAREALRSLLELEHEQQHDAITGKGFRTSGPPQERRGSTLERARFRRLVREAVATLPPDLLQRVQNVDIVVQRPPNPRDRKVAGLGPGGTLLGLYHGIPLTRRGEYYNLVLPDKISVYQEPIESICYTDDDIREQVRKTVIHELGHDFGIDDDRLDELGLG
jgi:predicted Zn-dependent protease with MMP-like domain